MCLFMCGLHMPVCVECARHVDGLIWPCCCWCPHFALSNFFTQGWQDHETLQGAPADLPCLPATLGGSVCPPARLPAWRILTHHPSPGRERTRQPGRTLPQPLTSAHRSLGYWCHHPTRRPPSFPVTPPHPFRFSVDLDSPRRLSLTLPCALTDCGIQEGRAHTGFISVSEAKIQSSCSVNETITSVGATFLICGMKIILCDKRILKRPWGRM